jgi:basic amino acid/polyamine antiporter, APA family
MSIKPKLSFFDLTMIVVSMVIGIGIFRNPGIIAKSAGSETIFYSAWVLGAIISIFGALTFAEIGSRIPVAGGYYKTFSFCFPPSLAFVFIWGYVALNSASTAAVAFAGAQYIKPVLAEYIQPGVIPHLFKAGNGEKLIFLVVILGLFGLNYMGIKMGSRTQNVLSSLKILLMLFIISLIFFPRHTVSTPNLIPTPSSYNWLQAFGVSLIAVFYSYGGYQNTTNLGADIHSPQKNIPRAIVTAMVMVLILYLAINFAYVHVLGFQHLQQSPLVASDFAKVFMGDFGSRFASIVIFISVLGFINSSMLFNPRVLYAMSEEGVLPKFFSHVNDRKQIQPYALAFFTLLVITFFLILETYEDLLNFVMFNDTIVLAAAAACIFILRRKQKDEIAPGRFKIRWYPFIPIVFIFVLICVTANIIISDHKNSKYGLIALLLGFPLYYIMKSISKSSTKTND